MQVHFSQKRCRIVWEVLAEPEIEWATMCLAQLRESSSKALRDDRNKRILKEIASSLARRGDRKSLTQVYQEWLRVPDLEESQYQSHTGYGYQDSYRESLLKSLRRAGDVRIFDDLVRRLKSVPHATYELEEFTVFFEAARKSLSVDELKRIEELESGRQWDEDAWCEEYRGQQSEWRMLTVDYSLLRDLAAQELNER